MDLNRVQNEMVEILAQGESTEQWDKWYASLPADLKYRLTPHDFKRLGDCFKKAFAAAQ